MALGIVQAGYKNSLYLYTAGTRLESEISYAEWLAELTTELELALESGTEDEVSDFETGEDNMEDDGTTEAYSNRKKEWEELLKQATVVEAMLRQMLENGLGQKKEEQQKPPEQQEEKETDNDFDLMGLPAVVEGRHKDSLEHTDFSGNSELRSKNSGKGSEYFSPSASGRQTPQVHAICLTCELDCDRKKQWKIT